MPLKVIPGLAALDQRSGTTSAPGGQNSSSRYAMPTSLFPAHLGHLGALTDPAVRRGLRLASGFWRFC